MKLNMLIVFVFITLLKYQISLNSKCEKIKTFKITLANEFCDYI